MAHTITGDNGKEFAGHESIAKQLDINFYFAHPYHSWERGANENTNGLIRQYIPKGTDFENGTQKQLDDVQYKLNNRPRKRLGFHSPREFSFIKFVKSKHKQKVAFEARIQQIKSLKMNKTSKIINVFSQSTYCKNNSSKHIGKTRFVITFLMISFISISIFAQENKDTLRVLFVGNSYTHVNNLPQITSIVSESINTKLITRESTLGGARLREHWFGLRGLKTKEKIKNGSFDIVVLQGYSMSTIDFPDSLKKYSKLFCDYIRENGAEPYFYLT